MNPGELPYGGRVSLGELFRLNAPICSGLRVTACLQEDQCRVLLRLLLLRDGQLYTVLLAPTSGISGQNESLQLAVGLLFSNNTMPCTT